MRCCLANVDSLRNRTPTGCSNFRWRSVSTSLAIGAICGSQCEGEVAAPAPSVEGAAATTTNASRLVTPMRRILRRTKFVTMHDRT